MLGKMRVVFAGCGFSANVTEYVWKEQAQSRAVGPKSLKKEQRYGRILFVSTWGLDFDLDSNHLSRLWILVKVI